jgi:hypothetical protein
VHRDRHGSLDSAADSAPSVQLQVFDFRLLGFWQSANASHHECSTLLGANVGIHGSRTGWFPLRLPGTKII